MRVANYEKQMNDMILFKNVQIFTDSKFVCNVLNINGYPQFDTHYNLIQKIFKLLKSLEKLNVDIEIIKIASHDGIIENIATDSIANNSNNSKRLQIW